MTNSLIGHCKLAARVIAWVGLLAIIILTVVPANERPVTGAGSNFEHLAIFAISFGAFTVGYRLSPVRLFLFAFLFCGAIELLQVPLPTRHARASDFVIDFASSSLAVVIALGCRRFVEGRA